MMARLSHGHDRYVMSPQASQDHLAQEASALAHLASRIEVGDRAARPLCEERLHRLRGIFRNMGIGLFLVPTTGCTSGHTPAGTDCHCLLHKPVKQFASAVGQASTEPERKFIQGLVQGTSFINTSLVGSQKPPLQQTCNLVYPWQKLIFRGSYDRSGKR